MSTKCDIYHFDERRRKKQLETIIESLLNRLLISICSLSKIEVTPVIIAVGNVYLGTFLSELFGQEGKSNSI